MTRPTETEQAALRAEKSNSTYGRWVVRHKWGTRFYWRKTEAEDFIRAVEQHGAVFVPFEEVHEGEYYFAHTEAYKNRPVNIFSTWPLNGGYGAKLMHTHERFTFDANGRTYLTKNLIP